MGETSKDSRPRRLTYLPPALRLMLAGGLVSVEWREAVESKPAYGIEELAKAGPLRRTYLFQAIKEKRLIAHKAGRRTIVTHENFQAFLRSLPVAGPAKRSDR